MIVVTGGAGFIGSSIVRQLIKDGYQVRVLTRSPNTVRRRLPPSVEIVAGDVRERASIDKAFKEARVVINVIQFPHHPIERPWLGYSYFEIDGKGTKRQVESALNAGAEHFVYLSGAGVGTMSKPWFNGKEMAETAIMQSGIPYTIFRPSWVYGPSDRSLNKFITFARKLPFVPVIGNGKTRVCPIYIEDLARAIVLSLNRPQAKNAVIEAGGPDELTMDEIVGIVLKVLGKRRPIIHQPKTLMKLAGFFLQFLPKPVLSPGAVDFVTMEVKISTAKFKAIFPEIGLTSLENALRGYIQA